MHIKCWIIELRINTGGNMYPIIAGLSDLIGKGRLVVFSGRINNLMETG